MNNFYSGLICAFLKKFQTCFVLLIYNTKYCVCVLLSEIIEISSLNENSSSLKKHNSDIKKIVIKRRKLDLNYQIILTQ